VKITIVERDDGYVDHVDLDGLAWREFQFIASACHVFAAVCDVAWDISDDFPTKEQRERFIKHLDNLETGNDDGP
jgi:hypothetical protein